MAVRFGIAKTLSLNSGTSRTLSPLHCIKMTPASDIVSVSGLTVSLLELTRKVLHIQL